MSNKNYSIMDIIFTVRTRNNKTERTSINDFNNELDAVNYAKIQMKRKLGNNYKELVKPFKGNILSGYSDCNFNFEFCIYKSIKDGNETLIESVIYEV